MALRWKHISHLLFDVYLKALSPSHRMHSLVSIRARHPLVRSSRLRSSRPTSSELGFWYKTAQGAARNVHYCTASAE